MSCSNGGLVWDTALGDLVRVSSSFLLVALLARRSLSVNGKH